MNSSKSNYTLYTIRQMPSSSIRTIFFLMMHSPEKKTTKSVLNSNRSNEKKFHYK